MIHPKKIKVYLACSSEGVKNNLDYYAKIHETVVACGGQVESKWISRVIKNKGSLSRKNPRLKEEAIEVLNTCDCLIADVSFPSISVGYQIYHAVSKNIPTLVLLSREIGSGKVPQVVEAIRSPKLIIRKYTTLELRGLLANFFKLIKGSKWIKFNCVITPEIYSFLDKGSKKFGISKSEFLRRQLERSIKLR